MAAGRGSHVDLVSTSRPLRCGARLHVVCGLFFVGVAVSGCFNPSNDTMNTSCIAALIWNGSTIAQSILESLRCFKMEFALSEPGDHSVELVASVHLEVENASVPCNGSIPLQLEVLKRESEQSCFCLVCDSQQTQGSHYYIGFPPFIMPLCPYACMQ